MRTSATRIGIKAKSAKNPVDITNTSFNFCPDPAGSGSYGRYNSYTARQTVFGQSRRTNLSTRLREAVCFIENGPRKGQADTGTTCYIPILYPIMKKFQVVFKQILIIFCSKQFEFLQKNFKIPQLSRLKAVEWKYQKKEKKSRIFVFPVPSRLNAGI
jgi:hypothetical protein